MPEKHVNKVIGALIGAAVGAALYGAADALAVVSGDTLQRSAFRHALLLVADSLALAALAVAVLLPLAVFVGWRQSAQFVRNAQWWGFVRGAAVVLLAHGAERWFTRPPPFVEVDPLRGNALVFGGFAIAVMAATWLLAHLLTTARGRALAVLGIGMLLCLRLLVERRTLPARGHAGPGAPNLLLVTIDTTRADHVSAYGHPEVQTPSFDRLASEGARFATAIAQIPVTGPSHITILSGLPPWEHGNLLNGVPVSAGVPLLAEQMRAAGYRTGAFVSAYVLEGDLGLSRGFEVYDDDFGWLQGWSGTAPGRLLAMAARHLSPDAVLERRASRTVDAALSWLDRDRLSMGAPFFAWVHLFDPHGPYAPPPPWDTAYYEGDPRDAAHTSMGAAHNIAPYLVPFLRGITDADWVRAQYAGEISYADQALGRLLSWLDDRGYATDTLVVVAGDHGESLGEHGVWFNHGDDLYEAATHVPMALRYPGHVPRGTVVNDPVELTDLAPTVLDLLDLAPEARRGGVPEARRGGVPEARRGGVPEARRGGISMASAMFGGSGRAFARSLCFDRAANVAARERGELDRPTWRMVALRGPNTRFVHREAPGYGDAFYDLTTDPTETHPVDGDPELVGLLRTQAMGLLSAMSDDSVERSTTELDPETRKKLEALGYME